MGNKSPEKATATLADTSQSNASSDAAAGAFADLAEQLLKIEAGYIGSHRDMETSRAGLPGVTCLRMRFNTASNAVSIWIPSARCSTAG